MKRVFSVVAAVVVLATGIVAMPGTASAATGCSASWHVITHGETGLNARPDPLVWQGNTGVTADGVPGTDYWNQWFLFCRDPNWAPNHYAIYSNLTSRYWAVTASGGVYAGAPGIVDKNQLFEILPYGNTQWSTIRWLGGFRLWSYYVRPDRGDIFNPLEAKTGVLTGNHLFRITPSNLLG